jgi:hypothetical protein
MSGLDACLLFRRKPGLRVLVAHAQHLRLGHWTMPVLFDSGPRRTQPCLHSHRLAQTHGAYPGACQLRCVYWGKRSVYTLRDSMESHFVCCRQAADLKQLDSFLGAYFVCLNTHRKPISVGWMIVMPAYGCSCRWPRKELSLDSRQRG